MRSSVAALVALAFLTLATSARSEPKKAAKGKVSRAAAVRVASAPPLPPLPPPTAPVVAPSAAPTPLGITADKPSAPSWATDEAPTGATFDFSGGIRAVAGSMSKDAESFNASGVALGFRGGYYFTRHFGVLAGIEASTGFMGKGCVAAPGTKEGHAECGAHSLNVPVVAQYAFVHRRETKGEIGGILQTSIRADVGRYTSGSASVGEQSVSGTIDPDQRAFHIALSLNVGRRF